VAVSADPSIVGWTKRVGQRVRDIERDVTALWIAARDPRTPALAKVVAALVAAYALSPIDFIPDLIPVLGYLGDIIIVPLGILPAIRLIPADLIVEFRNEATGIMSQPKSRIGLFIVLSLWCIILGFVAWHVWSAF